MTFRSYHCRACGFYYPGGPGMGRARDNHESGWGHLLLTGWVERLREQDAERVVAWMHDEQECAPDEAFEAARRHAASMRSFLAWARRNQRTVSHVIDPELADAIADALAQANRLTTRCRRPRLSGIRRAG